MTSTQVGIPADRAVGSILGLAFGDSVADPNEFKKYREITAAGGATIPAKLRITDDTQMSLAVWYALNQWDTIAPLGMLRMELMVEFIVWKDDVDNTRAPGTTCMSSLARLERLGLGGWVEATSPTSAGCGSVMRAPWVGLHPRVTDAQVAPVAMLQAVLTHGPAENAFCAAALAELTRALARDEVEGTAAEWLAEWANEHRRDSYDYAALSTVARRCGQTEVEYVAEGIEHVEWVARHAGLLGEALNADFWGFDPCEIAGEGWRARECVAVAVGILDGLATMAECLDEVDGVPAISPTDLATDALLRASETNGDSDSIGAITGALAGARLGDVWRDDLFARIEPRYQRELTGVCREV